MRSAGADVIITGVMPTAALSQLILDQKLDGGVMITASHNPPEDNGLKPLNHLGKKLSANDRESIQNLFDLKTDDIIVSGSSYEISSGWIPWIEKIWSFTRESSAVNSLRGEKIIIDSANGAAGHLASQALSLFGAKVIQIGMGDGEKINVDCGSLHPEKMINLVRTSRAIAGIALDGDGDRIQVCDSAGNLYDGDDILWLLRGNAKVVVGTIMSNEGLANSLKNCKVTLHRTAVGDSNVAEGMDKYYSPVGGEPSGHILFEDGMPTSCGVFTAAKLLALNPAEWSERLAGLSKTHQAVGKIKLQNIDLLKEKAEDLKKSGLRVVIRESGTEPAIRIMVEGEESISISGLNELLRMAEE
jgi:phosphoglucosamine mutase